MTKRTLSTDYDLSQMDFEKTLTLAFDIAKEDERKKTGDPLTYEKLALRCGMKTSTVHRYFTDPEYNPPTHKLPLLCRGLGNHILVEWLAINCGGFFGRVDRRVRTTSDLVARISKVNSETTAAVNCTVAAINDGIVSDKEKAAIVKELRNVVAAASEVIATVEG